MKTNELDGPALDYWVAASQRVSGECQFGQGGESPTIEDVADDGVSTIVRPYRPSLSWRDAGPIIEANDMRIMPWWPGRKTAYTKAWMAQMPGKRAIIGPTPLIAAMRAYVQSVYGDTVPEVVP